MRSFDQIIVGQGIAGSTLAWQLRWLGQNVAIIDRDEPHTASMIAAGLISPISGKRNAVSWRFHELFGTAKQFYRRVEEVTGEQFVGFQPMLKVLEDIESQSEPWLENENVKTFLGERTKLCEPLDAKREAIELQPAGRLNVPSYLAATRREFESLDAYFVGDFDSETDLKLSDGRVSLERFNVEAKRLIFCEGIRAQTNKWFDDIEFQPTKGEILTLRIPGLDEHRSIHGDGWLARQSDGVYAAGATYEREYADTQPSVTGRDDILGRLAELRLADFEVVDHRAALRPSIQGRLPKVGMSATHRQLGFFNGLGSKGSLRAPSVAEQFAKHLVHGDRIDSEISLRKIGGRSEDVSARRLTSQAHAAVSKVLAEGDVAVDATAGNGFDTSFLSRTVGERGRVYAIDIQPEAISRTRRRLEAVGTLNVKLLQGSHERLSEFIPSADHGSVSAIMFNLGYLPRGDERLTTKTISTRGAVEQGLSLLKPGGVMTILAYTGHPGGLEEAMSVEKFLGSVDDTHSTSIVRSNAADAPWLFVVNCTGAVRISREDAKPRR